MKKNLRTALRALLLGCKKSSSPHSFIDDGRTIATMNVEGMPWYKKTAPQKRAEQTTAHHDKPRQSIILNAKEFCAILVAGLWVVIPILAVFCAGYTLIMLFLHMVWLKG